MRFKLDRPDELPIEMVRVRGWRERVRGQVTDLDDFYMDKFEIRNRQYKIFMDSGGYSRKELWKEKFWRDGRELDWKDAIETFVDRTGRAGPSSWEVGDYPAGEEDFPVGGVSWYEAKAYARFVGKELPTVYHWRRAYGDRTAAWIIPSSNVQSEGLKRVGRNHAISGSGAFDMAGNVREWCLNERGSSRVILGGGFNDPDYLAGANLYTQPPFDRSPTNGIRLVRYLTNTAALDRSRGPIPERPQQDSRRATQVADAVFSVYQRMYAYDRLPLNSRIESADTSKHWIRQKISFDAAYGKERMRLYLYLPKNGSPPFQTVVYFPGSGAVGMQSVDQWRTIHADFVVRSGRAFAFPVLKGTFERTGEFSWDVSNTSTIYRDHVIQWSKDLGRSLDYLETRTDDISQKFAYYGFSWGGRVAPIMLAVEPRFDVAILYIAGIGVSPGPLPEANPLSYVSRVKIPVIVLSGRFDEDFPLETSARPLVELLGTAPERKRHVVSDGGHFVPRPQLIRETSLDRIGARHASVEW